jgi:hypothetical protein
LSEGQVLEQRAFTLLMALPGVVRVTAVRAQGVLKHFVVTRIFPRSDPAAFWRLARLWPFNTAELDLVSGSTRVDFLVRADEVSRFCAVLGGVGRGLEDETAKGGGNVQAVAK